MSRGQVLDVVVVGAGVVGASAALALADEGLSVALVEAHEPRRWDAEQPDLRVYAFAPDAEALLEALGVWPAVRQARAHRYRRMRVWDAAGSEELQFDADELGRAGLGHIVENGLLVDRLWQAAARHPGLRVLCPERLQAIERDDRGVRLSLAGGETLRARLALGADGAASKLRQLAGLEVDAHDYGQRALVAYVTTEQAHEDTAWQRFLSGGPLAFLPCADGRSSIVWTVPGTEAERLLALPDQAFCDELTRAFDARLGAVVAVSARAAFPLRRQLAQRMLDGRVALVGDAAHAVHPLAGQGVNLGLRDVADLRAVVRRARERQRDPLGQDLLERWARHRYSENAVAAHSFETINRVFSNDALLPTLARGHLLGIADRVPPLKRWFWQRAAGL